MAFKFRGGDRSSEDVTRRSKMSGGNYDNYLSSDAPFFKAKEGENTVRIMPPTWDDQEKWGNGWEIVVWLHRNVGPDNGTYLCLDKMKGIPCPICEARRDATDEDEAKELQVNPRPLCWVIDRNNEKAGPQVMGMPISLFRDINTRSIDKKTGDVLVIDGDKEGYGYDVMFNREGNDLRTKYTAVEIDREETALAESEKTQQRWLDFIEDHPLPDMLVFYEAAHIEKVLFGKSERRRGSEPAEEETDRRSERRGRREEPAAAEEAPRGRRGRAEPAEEEEVPRSRRGRSDPAEEEEAPARPSRGRREEPKEEVEEEAETTTVARRRPKDTEAEEETPSRQARRRLEGLRSRE